MKALQKDQFMYAHVASNVPNVFFKVKMKQVCDKVTLALQCFKTKGQKLKVKDILDDTERQKLINLDEGYLKLLEIHQHILRRERKTHLQCSDSLGLHHYSSLSHMLKQNGQNY